MTSGAPFTYLVQSFASHLIAVNVLSLTFSRLLIGLSVELNDGMGFLRRKRQNGGPLTQKAFLDLLTPSVGPISAGRGRIISGHLAYRFGSRFGTNTKLLRGVIGPMYLNTVFHEVISLCGSCRNNDLPMVPTGKASTCSAFENSFLTRKEYAI